MDKVSIRQLLIKKRSTISPLEKEISDELILKNMAAVAELKHAKTILGFYPNASEPQINPYLEQSLLRKADLYLPRVNEEQLDICQIQSFKDLEQNKLKVFEPSIHHHVTNLENFEVILLPGLAFNKDGYRIGYGRGFYDRLLARTQGLRIATAYEFQYNIHFEHEAHDQKIDILITDRNIYRFNL